MVENIDYKCSANCIHNGYRGTGYSSCHLKNKGLKTNKDTRKVYGNKCGFYESIERSTKKEETNG